MRLIGRTTRFFNRTAAVVESKRGTGSLGIAAVNARTRHSDAFEMGLLLAMVDAVQTSNYEGSRPSWLVNGHFPTLLPC